MRARPSLHIIAAAIAISLVATASPADAGVNFFGIHFGRDDFGVSLGFSDWAVYGDAWANPHWSLDYNVMLSGYGEWVSIGGLGRVWRPHVAVGWQPFTHGRWVYTGYGWTWVAYEPWGYFPHHYGSWAMSTFGWVWQPGYTYSPANVVWVSSGGHVGWYARAPRGWSHAHRAFHHGYDHGYHSGYGDGYRDGWSDARYATFVSWRHMTAHNVSRHAVTHRAVERAGARGAIQSLSAPPSRSQVRARTGSAVPEARIEERTVRSGDRRVNLARPIGVQRSVQDNARGTVDRALAPDVPRRVESARRHAANSRGASAVRTSATTITRPGRSTRTAAAAANAAPNRQTARQPSATAARSGGRTTSSASQSAGIERNSRRTDAREPSASASARSSSSDRPPAVVRSRGEAAPSTTRSGAGRAPTRTVAASARNGGAALPSARRQTSATPSSTAASPAARGDRRQVSTATRGSRSPGGSREATRSTAKHESKERNKASHRPRRR